MAIPKGFRKLKKLEESIQLKDRKKNKCRRFKKVEWTPNGWAVPVDTFQALVDELLRQIGGDKDLHDRFIESYIKKLNTKIKK